MKIAFCDDDLRLTEMLSDYTRSWAESTGTSVDYTCYNTSEDFLLAWTSSTMFDVIFLDIKMEPLSGLELAHIIRSINNEVPIVFITAHSEYALDGYSVNAAHYLIKPVSRETFYECMNKVISRAVPVQRKFLLIEKGGKTIKLHHDEIIYFEARSHVIIAHTLKGSIEYRARMADIEQTLTPSDGFARIHRSFLVNLAQVREMNKAETLMENGDRLPISRSYSREAYNEYIRYVS